MVNFETIVLILAAGYGTSFLVMDVSRVVAGRAWPLARGAGRENFRVLPVLLALFAGPALFVAALWRMRGDGRLPAIDCAVAAVIACGWAGCYGVLVLQCAALLRPLVA